MGMLKGFLIGKNIYNSVLLNEKGLMSIEFCYINYLVLNVHCLITDKNITVVGTTLNWLL